jgi:hypothetical protein
VRANFIKIITQQHEQHTKQGKSHTPKTLNGLTFKTAAVARQEIIIEGIAQRATNRKYIL